MKRAILTTFLLLICAAFSLAQNAGRYNGAAIKLTLEQQSLTIELDKARMPAATNYISIEAFVPGSGEQFYAAHKEGNAVLVVGVINHRFTISMQEVMRKLRLKPGLYWLSFNAEEAGFASRLLEYTHTNNSLKNE